MKEIKKTILLVEDEVMIALAEEKQLTNAGYNVITAYNGEDAVSAVSSGNHAFDLILMDIDLGRGMDGTSAAIEILKCRDIPILFRSCHTEKDIVEKTEMITSYGYVVKHSDITILDASIKMAFKLHNAHLELKQKEKNLLIKERAIESSMNAVAISDTDGKLVYVNKAFLKLWGCENYKDVIGSPASSYWSECKDPNFIKDLIKTCDGWNGEIIARKRDGSPFYAEVSANIINEQDGNSIGMIAAFQDITLRKQTENSIRESRECYRILVENINYLVCEIDFKGNYTYLSPTYKTVTGYEPEELLGANVLDRVHPDDLDRLKERYLGKGVTASPVRDLWRFRIKSGEWRWMECSVNYYEKSPGEKRGVVISSDITDWINNEKERYSLIKKKEEFLLEIQDSNRSNAGVIRLYLTHLIRKLSENSSKKMLAGTEKRILFMVKIYEQLFAASDPDDINLYEMIKRIVTYISEVYRAETDFVIAEELTGIVVKVRWAVPVGLIISELVVNSLRHGCPPGKKITVTIFYEKEGDNIKLFIADNGIGFKGEFDPDYSDGMGLFLADILANQIQGKLVFEKAEGTLVYLQFAP